MILLKKQKILIKIIKLIKICKQKFGIKMIKIKKKKKKIILIQAHRLEIVKMYQKVIKVVIKIIKA